MEWSGMEWNGNGMEWKWHGMEMAWNGMAFRAFFWHVL